MNAKPLPCPFCGSEGVCRFDGPEVKPFYVRCERVGCPGFNQTQTFAEGEVAMARWNQRVQLPPPKRERVELLDGYARKDLIRGEMIFFELDRTGVLTSEKIVFSPWSTPLTLRRADGDRCGPGPGETKFGNAP